jgi:hypothetical protein
VIDLVFFLGVSSLLVHEMDAVDKKEWHFLFVLRKLPDHGALRWFIGLHLPIYLGLLALVAAGPSSTVHLIEGLVDGFLIAHAGLHERFSAKGEGAFANVFSRSLIWLAAGFGAVHLVILLAR